MKFTIEVEVDWFFFVSELGMVGQSCKEDALDSLKNLVDMGLPIAQQKWIKSVHVH